MEEETTKQGFFLCEESGRRIHKSRFLPPRKATEEETLKQGFFFWKIWKKKSPYYVRGKTALRGRRFLPSYYGPHPHAPSASPKRYPVMDTITPLLTDCDAAEILRVSTKRLARLTRDSRIPHVRLPDGQIRYSGPALRAWIREHEVAPTTAPLKTIPPIAAVRERLATNIREGLLLRQMLKLAEKADKE